MPHSAEVILEDDLCDKVKPGDRVAVLGVYKTTGAARVTRFHGGVFRAVLVGVSVQQLTREHTVKHTYEEVGAGGRGEGGGSSARTKRSSGTVTHSPCVRMPRGGRCRWAWQQVSGREVAWGGLHVKLASRQVRRRTGSPTDEYAHGGATVHKCFAEANAAAAHCLCRPLPLPLPASATFCLGHPLPLPLTATASHHTSTITPTPDAVPEMHRMTLFRKCTA
eukprot:333054-Chlamydomonas_euryale.AAC.3